MTNQAEVIAACDSLNENCQHRFACLNTWSSVELFETNYEVWLCCTRCNFVEGDMSLEMGFMPGYCLPICLPMTEQDGYELSAIALAPFLSASHHDDHGLTF